MVGNTLPEVRKKVKTGLYAHVPVCCCLAVFCFENYIGVMLINVDASFQSLFLFISKAPFDVHTVYLQIKSNPGTYYGVSCQDLYDTPYHLICPAL